MGKISLVSAKYIIHATITVDGIVDRPDIIGSVFGQTEGLLGNDLELRELQSSGRIGRIEVETTAKDGKTKGEIKIPSSMDKTETALIAAAVETIQRIGPCNAEVKVTKLEDVRAAKRTQVIDRAKLLLSGLTHGQDSPDSRDIKEKVSTGAKMADIETFGKDKLPAGPDVKDANEIIVVEGRADVINLLRYDIKNAIAMNGTSVPKTIIELSKKKELIVFLDGDRGGDLILKELAMVAKDIRYVARAPDGKEVEEITQKEIHQALRGKLKFQDAIDQIGSERNSAAIREERTPYRRPERSDSRDGRREFRPRESSERRGFRSDGPRRDFRPRSEGMREFRPRESFDRPLRIPLAQREKFIKLVGEIEGSKEAYILDGRSNILGKVPIKDLAETMQEIGRLAFAVVLDGAVSEELLQAAEGARIRYMVGTKASLKEVRSSVKVLTKEDLQ